MKYFSEKLTSYIVKSGAVPEESYEIYQYGFQIGLEMLSCLLACFGIAVYLHMIPEFAVVTGIFMMLRSFVGGVHLNSFDACFMCSVTVQTLVLVVNRLYTQPLNLAWGIIVLSSVLIWNMAPVQSINRELDADEKKTLQKGSCKNYCGHICVCGDLYTYWDECNSVFGCSDNGSSFDFTIYWGSKV